MIVELETAPASEPLEINQVKNHLGIDENNTFYDERLNRLITGARKTLEEQTAQRFITQVVNFHFDDLNRVIKIPVLPVQSIDSFTYYDENGAQQSMNSVLYFSDIVSKPPKIVLKSDQFWPSLEKDRPNRCTIQMTVGYGAAIAVPEEITIALFMMIEILFDRPDVSYQDALTSCKNSVLGQHYFNWF